MISTDEEFKVFSKIAGKFGIRKLQDIVNINKYLKANDYSLEDIEAFVDWEIKKTEKKLKDRRDDFQRIAAPLYRETIEAMPQCPECGEKIVPAAIKQKEGDGNIHGYKSVWQCSGPKCFYEKYNKELKGDILKSFIGTEKTKVLSKYNKAIEISGE